MKKWIEIEFDAGEIVYLKTDKDQQPRIVTGISVRNTGVLYDLGCGSSSSWHYGFEISKEINVLTKVIE